MRYVFPVVVLQDYPPSKNDRRVAAADLGRLTLLGKIRWYSEGGSFPDLRVCPPQLILNVDKAREAQPKVRPKRCAGEPPRQVG